MISIIKYAYNSRLSSRFYCEHCEWCSPINNWNVKASVNDDLYSSSSAPFNKIYDTTSVSDEALFRYQNHRKRCSLHNWDQLSAVQAMKMLNENENYTKHPSQPDLNNIYYNLQLYKLLFSYLIGSKSKQNTFLFRAKTDNFSTYRQRHLLALIVENTEP